MADPHRIDVHAHFAPPEWIAAQGQNIIPAIKNWTAAWSIEDMDKAGVEKALLSITTPGLWFENNETARKIARHSNEYAATLRANHPGRFGLFTALPLPDVEGSLKEIAFGMDTLKADGVGLITSYANKWLGDPAFDPVLEELNRRKAVAYVHPTSPDCCRNIVPGVPDAAIEFGTDTTRCIARIVFGGAAARFPDIKWIFSHAGGTMPFLAERFEGMAKMPNYAAEFPERFCRRGAALFLRHGAGREQNLHGGAARDRAGVAHRVRHRRAVPHLDRSCPRLAELRRVQRGGIEGDRPGQCGGVAEGLNHQGTKKTTNVITG